MWVIDVELLDSDDLVDGGVKNKIQNDSDKKSDGKCCDVGWRKNKCGRSIYKYNSFDAAANLWNICVISSITRWVIGGAIGNVINLIGVARGISCFN